MTQLKEEESELESDPCLTNVQYLIKKIEELANVQNFQTGIPDEAVCLTCPYEDLKTSVLNEFELLDKRYETYLDCLKMKYESVLEYVCKLYNFTLQ